MMWHKEDLNYLWEDWLAENEMTEEEEARWEEWQGLEDEKQESYRR